MDNQETPSILPGALGQTGDPSDFTLYGSNIDDENSPNLSKIVEGELSNEPKEKAKDNTVNSLQLVEDATKRNMVDLTGDGESDSVGWWEIDAGYAIKRDSSRIENDLLKLVASLPTELYTLRLPKKKEAHPHGGACKPAGWRTVCVEGFPEGATEDLARDLFQRIGKITEMEVRETHCKIRFEQVLSADLAVGLSGYTMVVNGNGGTSSGVLRVKYWKNLDDLPVRICPKPLGRIPSLSLVQATEIIGHEDKFLEAVRLLITWLENELGKDDDFEKFFSMIQITNDHATRLLAQRKKLFVEMRRARNRCRGKVEAISSQIRYIERLFNTACQEKVLDHFTIAQRKSLDMWKTELLKKQTENSSTEDEYLSSEADEELRSILKAKESLIIENANSRIQKEISALETKHKTELESKNEEIGKLKNSLKKLEDDLTEANELRINTEKELAQIQTSQRESEKIVLEFSRRGYQLHKMDNKLKSCEDDLREERARFRSLDKELTQMKRRVANEDHLNQSLHKRILEKDKEYRQYLTKLETRLKDTEDRLREAEDKLKETEQTRPEKRGGELPRLREKPGGFKKDPPGDTFNDRDAVLISLISSFLLIHPEGVDFQFIVGYVERMDPTVEAVEIQSVLVRGSSVFSCDVDETKWMLRMYSKSASGNQESSRCISGARSHSTASTGPLTSPYPPLATSFVPPSLPPQPSTSRAGQPFTASPAADGAPSRGADPSARSRQQIELRSNGLISFDEEFRLVTILRRFPDSSQWSPQLMKRLQEIAVFRQKFSFYLRASKKNSVKVVVPRPSRKEEEALQKSVTNVDRYPEEDRMDCQPVDFTRNDFDSTLIGYNAFSSAGEAMPQNNQWSSSNAGLQDQGQGGTTPSAPPSGFDSTLIGYNAFSSAGEAIPQNNQWSSSNAGSQDQGQGGTTPSAPPSGSYLEEEYRLARIVSNFPMYFTWSPALKKRIRHFKPCRRPQAKTVIELRLPDGGKVSVHVPKLSAKKYTALTEVPIPEKFPEEYAMEEQERIAMGDREFPAFFEDRQGDWGSRGAETVTGPPKVPSTSFDTPRAGGESVNPLGEVTAGNSEVPQEEALPTSSNPMASDQSATNEGETPNNECTKILQPQIPYRKPPELIINSDQPHQSGVKRKLSESPRDSPKKAKKPSPKRQTNAEKFSKGFWASWKNFETQTKDKRAVKKDSTKKLRELSDDRARASREAVEDISNAGGDCDGVVSSDDSPRLAGDKINVVDVDTNAGECLENIATGENSQQTSSDTSESLSKEDNDSERPSDKSKESSEKSHMSLKELKKRSAITGPKGKEVVEAAKHLKKPLNSGKEPQVIVEKASSDKDAVSKKRKSEKIHGRFQEVKDRPQKLYKNKSENLSKDSGDKCSTKDASKREIDDAKNSGGAHREVSVGSSDNLITKATEVGIVDNPSNKLSSNFDKNLTAEAESSIAVGSKTKHMSTDKLRSEENAIDLKDSEKTCSKNISTEAGSSVSVNDFESQLMSADKLYFDKSAARKSKIEKSKESTKIVENSKSKGDKHKVDSEESTGKDKTKKELSKDEDPSKNLATGAESSVAIAEKDAKMSFSNDLQKHEKLKELRVCLEQLTSKHFSRGVDSGKWNITDFGQGKKDSDKAKNQSVHTNFSSHSDRIPLDSSKKFTAKTEHSLAFEKRDKVNDDKSSSNKSDAKKRKSEKSKELRKLFKNMTRNEDGDSVDSDGNSSYKDGTKKEIHKNKELFPKIPVGSKHIPSDSKKALTTEEELFPSIKKSEKKVSRADKSSSDKNDTKKRKGDKLTELRKRFFEMSGKADENLDSDGSGSNEAKGLSADKFPSDFSESTTAQAETTLPMETCEKQASGDKQDSDKNDAKKRKRERSKESKKTSSKNEDRADSDGTCSNKAEAQKELENVKDASGSTKISLDLKYISSDLSKNLTAEKRVLSADKTAFSDDKEAKKQKSEGRKTLEISNNEDVNPNVDSGESYSNKDRAKNELGKAKDLSASGKLTLAEAESFSASENLKNINATEKRKSEKPRVLMEDIERTKKKKERSSSHSKNIVASESSTGIENSEKQITNAGEPFSGKTDNERQEKLTEPSQEREMPMGSEENRSKIDDPISDETIEDSSTSNKDISVETKDEERARKIREKNWQDYKKKYQGSMKSQHVATTGKNSNDTGNSEGLMRKDTGGAGDVSAKLSIEKIWESVRKPPDVLKEKSRVPSKLRGLSPQSINSMKKAKQKKKASASDDRNEVDVHRSSKAYISTTSNVKISEEVQKSKKIMEEADIPSSKASDPQLEGQESEGPVQNMGMSETPSVQVFGARINILASDIINAPKAKDTSKKKTSAYDDQNQADAQGVSKDCTGTTKTSGDAQESMEVANEPSLKGSGPLLEGQGTEGSVQRMEITETPSKKVLEPKINILTSDTINALQTIDTPEKKKSSACDDQNKVDAQESSKDHTDTTSKEKTSEDVQESMEEANETSLKGDDPQLEGQEPGGTVRNMGMRETPSEQVFVPKIKILTPDLINASHEKSTSEKKKKPACDDPNKADLQESSKDYIDITTKEKTSEDVQKSMKEASEPSLKEGGPQVEGQESDGSVQKMEASKTPFKPIPKPKVRILSPNTINASQAKNKSKKKKKNRAEVPGSSKDRAKTSENVLGSGSMGEANESPLKEKNAQVVDQTNEESFQKMEVKNFEPCEGEGQVESQRTTEAKMETDESPTDDFLSFESKEGKLEEFSKDAQDLRNELQELFGTGWKTEGSGSSMDIDKFFCDTHWSSEDIRLMAEDRDDDSNRC